MTSLQLGELHSLTDLFKAFMLQQLCTGQCGNHCNLRSSYLIHAHALPEL